MMRSFFILFAFISLRVTVAQDTLDVYHLESVTIQSYRVGETAPISQVTLEKSKIISQDIGQSVAQILERNSPSILSYSDAGTSFANYNQFRLRGVDQSRVNVTLDGVPLNDMIDQGVFFSNFPDFTSSVASIQIHRGVGVSENGTASFAGSVSFESPKMASQKDEAILSLTYGSFKTLKINAETTLADANRDLSAYVRASRVLSDGYKYNSASDGYSIFFSAGKFFKKSLLKLTGLSGKTQNGQSYLPVLKEDIDADPRTNTNAAYDTDDTGQSLVQLQYANFLSPNTTWQTTLYYNTVTASFPFSGYFYHIKNNHYGVISAINAQLSKMEISSGIHTYLFNRENWNGSLGTTDYSDKTDKKEISFFVKSKADLGKLSLFADIQLRTNKMIFNSDTLLTYAGSSKVALSWLFLNPRVGLTYFVNEKSNIYCFFGRTSREPTRTDLLMGDGSAIYAWNYNAIVDQNVINPETVNNLEIGYRFSSQKMKANFNLFLMGYKNEISQVGGLAQNSYIALRQNVDKSKRNGLELDFLYYPTRTLSIHILGTYMKTQVKKFDNGTVELHNVSHVFSPKWIVNPSIDWKILDKIDLSLATRYVSNSFTELSNNSEFQLPSFFVIDAHLRWKISPLFETSFWINNIFNERYFTDGAPVDIEYDGVVDGVGYRIQPPRNGFISLKFKI